MSGLRLASRLLLVGVAGVMLASCGSRKDAITQYVEQRQQACPPVRLDRTTAHYTDYVGSKFDDDSIAVNALIQSVTGSCQVDLKKRTADVLLAPIFRVTRGKAFTGDTVTLHYYVAIPAFFPSAAGKQVFDAPVSFAGKAQVSTQVVRDDDDIHIVIPLGNKTPAELPVYIGFQLTDEERQNVEKLKSQPSGPDLLK